MVTRRTRIRRSVRPRLHTSEMREKAMRLLELTEAHSLAILDARPENQTFYTDGRHEELCALSSEVHLALGIKPWQDDIAILREALGLDGRREPGRPAGQQKREGRG